MKARGMMALHGIPNNKRFQVIFLPFIDGESRMSSGDTVETLIEAKNMLLDFFEKMPQHVDMEGIELYWFIVDNNSKTLFDYGFDTEKTFKEKLKNGEFIIGD